MHHVTNWQDKWDIVAAAGCDDPTDRERLYRTAAVR